MKKRKNKRLKVEKSYDLKSTEDLHDSIQMEIIRLATLTNKAKPHEFMCGTIVLGANAKYTANLLDSSSEFQANMRLKLADYADEYVLVTGFITDIKQFKKHKKLLILSPKLVGSYYGKPHLKKDKRDAMRALSTKSKPQFVDHHVWLELDEMKSANPYSNLTLAAGMQIFFAAKVHTYNGRSTKDLRIKTKKYGLNEVKVIDAGYPLFDAQTIEKIDYMRDIASSSRFDMRGFELASWNRKACKFERNLNRKEIEFSRNIKELTDDDYIAEKQLAMINFLMQYDPDIRSMCKSAYENLDEALEILAENENGGMFR